jgi:hypothetical protein
VTDAAKDTLYTVLERWGFPTLVAIAVGWVLRHDVLLPLVEEHRVFVRSLSETQSEISKAVTEQTKLLYEMRQMRDQP